MDANRTSTESSVDRHHRLSQELRDGNIADPERGLFLKLLDLLPMALAATPHLHDVSWQSGQCDLLFTDGRDTWCAVEVKHAPAITGTGPRRKNCRTKWSRKYKQLQQQTRVALAACRRLRVGIVRALGLWYEDGEWHVAASLDARV